VTNQVSKSPDLALMLTLHITLLWCCTTTTTIIIGLILLLLWTILQSTSNWKKIFLLVILSKL